MRSRSRSRSRSLSDRRSSMYKLRMQTRRIRILFQQCLKHTGALSTVPYRGHRQPVRQEPSGALSTVHTEGTGNQPGRGAAGHRGRRQPDRKGANTVGHTEAWGTVYSTYRVHWQPVGGRDATHKGHRQTGGAHIEDNQFTY